MAQCNLLGKMGGSQFRIGLFFLALIIFPYILCECRKEDRQGQDGEWKKRKEEVMKEMEGRYEGEMEKTQIGGSDISTKKVSLQYSLDRFAMIRLSAQEEVIRVDLEVSRITEENAFLSLPQAQYWKLYQGSKRVGTNYGSAGNPQFSGYIGVYDRKAKTFQVSLRVKEVYNTKSQKIELDYTVLCSGKRK